MVHERFDASGWVPPWIRHEHRARYEFAAQHVRGRVVVDCASGDGTGAALFAQAGAAVVKGYDASAHAVEHAQRRHPAPAFQQADALHLPLGDAFADVFVSLETIEHLDSGEAGARDFVDEIARILKPDGLLICSTPNRIVYNPGKRPDATPWNRFHVREYSRAEFTAILRRRFGSVEMYAQNPRPRFLTGALGLLGRAPGHLAVRFTQALKVASAPFDAPSDHRVVPADPAVEYEYLVALCSRPTRPD